MPSQSEAVAISVLASRNTWSRIIGAPVLLGLISAVSLWLAQSLGQPTTQPLPVAERAE